MNKYKVIWTDYKDREDSRGIVAKSKQDALDKLYNAGFFDSPRLKDLRVEDEGPLSPKEEAVFNGYKAGKTLFTATAIDTEGRLRIFDVWDDTQDGAVHYVSGIKWLSKVISVEKKEDRV